MTPKILELDTLKPSTKNLSSAMKDEVYSLVDHFYITYPKKLIYEVKRVDVPTDVNQVYYWSEEWQKDEQEIDEEFKTGNVKKFSSPKELIAHLRK